MSLETGIIALAEAVGADVKEMNVKTGDLTQLTTTAKNNLVAAINEAAEQLSDENYTLAEKDKLEGIAEQATKNRADSANADKVHAHVISDVTGLPTRLNGIEALVSASDEGLRQDLANPDKGAAMVGYGDGSVADKLDEIVSGAVTEPLVDAKVLAHNHDANSHPELRTRIVSEVSSHVTAEADRAKAASDAAFVNADVYPAVEAGLAAAAVGEQFQVLSADGLEYRRYRKDSDTVATPVGVGFPTPEAVHGIASDSSEPLEVHMDKDGQVYQYTDSEGDVFLTGLSGSIQKNLNAAAGVGALNRLIYQSVLTLRYEKKKTLTPVATKEEDGLTKRMPSGIVTPNGMVYFYHKQVPGFNGDIQGSELWKALVAIDDQLNVTVTSRELFLAPDEPRGIIKHPTLGRTSDGRILLMFERRLETSDAYTRYQCFSSNEGVTFSDPEVVAPLGVNPGVSSALGTTGTIVTARNGRLVVPMYTVGGGTCYCIFSDDDGESWTFSNWLATVGYEPSISLDMDDNLIMDIRPRRAPTNRVRAISLDNGVSWSLLEDLHLIPTALSQGVVFRDESIGLMIQANPTNISGPRNKYCLFLSYDNLKTVPFVYQPFDDEWYGGYSQVLKWRDGVYLINIEYAEAFTQLNREENSGILVLSLQEVISNVRNY